MGRYRFALEPLLDHRRASEERMRREVAEHARACLAAHAAWQEAAERLMLAARDRAVLERLETRRREAWLARERRRAEE
jgi:hypothetical protein